MQVGVPIGGSLQLLKTVAVQCGSCCGILSVALPPDEAPAPASVELLPLMQVLTVPCPPFALARVLAHWPNDDRRVPFDETGGRRR